METCHTRSIFPSSVIQRQDVSGFQMMEALYYANTKVPPHSHEQAVFCLALKGRCAEVYSSEIREYQPLTVQFLPPNETHSLEISSLDVRAFSVEVAPHWFDRTREYSLFLDKSVHSRGGLLSRLFMTLYKEFRQMDARGFRRFRRCSIGEYIRQLRIEHACHELCKTDTSLAAIASAAGFSDQSHFSRTFKRYMEMTPAQYRAAFSRR